MRQFCALHWEGIITKSAEFVIIPPRNYTTDFAYINDRGFFHQIFFGRMGGGETKDMKDSLNSKASLSIEQV